MPEGIQDPGSGARGDDTGAARRPPSAKRILAIGLLFGLTMWIMLSLFIGFWGLRPGWLLIWVPAGLLWSWAAHWIGYWTSTGKRVGGDSNEGKMPPSKT
jgi:hypothetical protein